MAKHFGKWLKRQVAMTGMTQTAFADVFKFSRQTLGAWFSQPSPRMREDWLPRLAKAFGLPIEEVEKELTEAQEEQKKIGEEIVAMLRIEVLNEPGKFIFFPAKAPIVGRVSAANLEPGSDDQLSYIDIDAGTHFFLRCSGDCMAPMYQDGELILCDSHRVQEEGVIDGKPYAIRFAGEAGDTTLKLAFNQPSSNDQLLLKCFNRRYKAERKVRLDQIVRIGRAIYALRDTQ